VIAQDCAADVAELCENLRAVPADEVLVVDGGSRDGTAAVARRAGARVVERPWPGHWGEQKNAAYDLARGDWILNVDADERVGERLCAALPDLVASRRHVFYRVPMYWLAGLDPPRYVRSPQHYPCPVPRLFLNLPEHRYEVGDGRLHPTFPAEVVRRMTKLRGRRAPHLFHLLLARATREALEAKMRAYEAQDPASRATNRKYYAFWETPHTVEACAERIAGPLSLGETVRVRVGELGP
jgi:glycosyltransferase involved in cell wall biosynthesis